MALLDDFNAVIKKENLFATTDHLLLAVSGGIDSMVLCQLCFQSGFSFSIVHVNFQLRGAESDRDAAFVQQAAALYQVPFLVKTVDTTRFAAENRISIQEAARVLRYDWFETLAAEKKAAGLSAWVLTGHQEDDAIETSAMHFFRGTGLKGLLGIPARNHYLRRPLLSFSRATIAIYAKEQGLQWLEDASNQQSKYTRNFFRNELFPLISSVYPQVRENLAANLRRFRGTKDIYEQGLERLRKQLLQSHGASFRIPVLPLIKHDNVTLIYELLRPFGFTEGQAEEAQRLLLSDSGHFITAAQGSWRLIRHQRWMYLAPVQQENDTLVVMNEQDARVAVAGFTLEQWTEERSAGDIPRLPQTEACLDARAVQFPLILRKWKPGDYFYPLGMAKKKKIARFLIDQRIPLHEKDNVWVLESRQRIIWVVGHRIDHRFRVVPGTQKCLRLRVLKTS